MTAEHPTDSSPLPVPQDIVAYISVVSGCPLDDLLSISARQPRAVARLRYAAWYLLFEKCGISSTSIGELWGARRERAITDGCRRFQKILEDFDDYRAIVQKVWAKSVSEPLPEHDARLLAWRPRLTRAKYRRKEFSEKCSRQLPLPPKPRVPDANDAFAKAMAGQNFESYAIAPGRVVSKLASHSNPWGGTSAASCAEIGE